MATYYCRHLENYSKFKGPLTALTKQNATWQWGPAEEAAFQAIKQLLVSAPVLRFPDWNKEFILHTDWSKEGMGACLSQIGDDGVEYAVAFASHMNTNAEANLSAFEGEVGAVVWAVQRFRYYLWGHKWKLITDCAAIQWLRTTARLRGKLARWSPIVAEYDFDVKHRAGKDNTVPDCLSRHPIVTGHHGNFAKDQAAMAFTAGMLEGLASVWPSKDIWDSPMALGFVRGEVTAADVSPEQLAVLLRKCSAYTSHQGRIWRTTTTKSSVVKREVPPPAERAGIIRQTHCKLGHLGRDRTYHVLSRHYVWPGMHKDVAKVVSDCRECDRVKASFSVKHDRLKPLPLFGLFYRFSVDSAWPLPQSVNGYKYCIVICEHFSKWIEIVPVKEISSATTARAFYERVLARYGAPVEVVSDNGSEYQGAFREQLLQNGIQPVYIPPGHPQSNGMAERIVQVLKKALRKVVPVVGSDNWELHIPVIEFGYRVSKQQSTGFSPYFLLFGRDHYLPEQVRQMAEESVDVENYEAMLDLVVHRSAILRDSMPKAFERALQAQFRDVVRYKKVRRGDVAPRRHRFEVGHYVYVTQQPLNTLDVSTTRTILRVVEVDPSGLLRLMGADGQEITVHMDRCAPCHLSNLVPARQLVSGSPCAGCGSDSTAAPRLLCDKCQQSWHVSCTDPGGGPGEEWLCPQCRPPR